MYVSEEDFFDDYFDDFPLVADEANIAQAREFCLEKWVERHRDLKIGSPAPVDLTNACKFTALFGSVVFGADIAGNYDHVFNVLDDERIDINEGSSDVLALEDPYRHDPNFIHSPEFEDSMKSCVSRVEGWINEFSARHLPASAPR